LAADAEGGDRSQTIRRLHLWLLLLILVLAPALIAVQLFMSHVGIVDLAGKQRAFRPILLNYFGLTPPDSCDNLGPRWPNFKPLKTGTFHIPYGFSSLLVVNAAGATQVEVAVVDSPKALPEENND